MRESDSNPAVRFPRDAQGQISREAVQKLKQQLCCGGMTQETFSRLPFSRDIKSRKKTCYSLVPGCPSILSSCPNT